MSNFKKRMESYRRHPGSFLLFLLVMLSALATFVVLRKMLLCCLPS